MIKNYQGFDREMSLRRINLGPNIIIFSIYSMRNSKSPNLVFVKKIRICTITTKVSVVFPGYHQL